MTVDISSPHNVRIRNAGRLRTRRGRRQQRRIIIDGLREILKAIESGIEIEEIFVCEAAWSADSQALVDSLTHPGVTVYNASQRAFEKIAFGHRVAEPVAVAKAPVPGIDRLKISGNPLIGIVEGIEKPGNLGAILRSADGAGLDAVVVVEGGTDLFNPNTIRASLGTVFTLNVCVASFEALASLLRQHQIQILLASVGKGTDYATADYTTATAIVLGGEATGLLDRWRHLGHTCITLPMLGAADSLNVSAAAAVLFYEAQRQRRRDRSAEVVPEG